MAILSTLFQVSLGLLATSVIATPLLQPRASIPHTSVLGFPETVPSGTVGAVYEAYQPFLKVVNGCVPYPAVNAAGDTSAGLNPSGGSNAMCSSNTGQIYVRGATYGNYYAVMYSWYFPKDEPSDGLGHRHDWEGVIIFLKSGTAVTASNIAAVCPSAHGGWDCVTSGYSLSGTGALIKYESIWPVNHACGLTTQVGGQQPLIAWEDLTAAARTALQNTDFGSGNVPFKDGNFMSNLASATFLRKNIRDEPGVSGEMS